MDMNFVTNLILASADGAGTKVLSTTALGESKDGDDGWMDRSPSELYISGTTPSGRASPTSASRASPPSAPWWASW